MVSYNARKSSGLKTEKSDKGVRLKDKFTTLLWLAAGAPIPQLEGLAAMPLTAKFQAHESTFRNRRGTPRSFGFAIAEVRRPEGGLRLGRARRRLRPGRLRGRRNAESVRAPGRPAGRRLARGEAEERALDRADLRAADRMGPPGSAAAPVHARRRRPGRHRLGRQGREAHRGRDARAPGPRPRASFDSISTRRSTRPSASTSRPGPSTSAR